MPPDSWPPSMLYRACPSAIAVPERWSRPQAKQKKRSGTVSPSPDLLKAFRVAEAKVIRGRRLGVARVVPFGSLRVQGPRETVVRLPPGQDGPPRGADAAPVQPPPADRRG